MGTPKPFFISIRTTALALICVCLLGSTGWLIFNKSSETSPSETETMRTAPYFAAHKPFLSINYWTNSLLVGKINGRVLIKRDDNDAVYAYDLTTNELTKVPASDWKRDAPFTNCKDEYDSSAGFDREYKSENGTKQNGFTRLAYSNGALKIENRIVPLRGERFDKSLNSPSKQKIAVLSYDGPVVHKPGFIFGGSTLIKGNRYVQIFSGDGVKELTAPVVVKVASEDSLPFLCWGPDESVLVAYEYDTRYFSFIDLNLYSAASTDITKTTK